MPEIEENAARGNMRFQVRRRVRLVGLTLAVLITLALPPLAFSQGCALCYTQVAKSGARIIQALREGIVILIIPPLSICVAGIVFAYRKRNHFNQADLNAESGSDW